MSQWVALKPPRNRHNVRPENEAGIVGVSRRLLGALLTGAALTVLPVLAYADMPGNAGYRVFRNFEPAAHRQSLRPASTRFWPWGPSQEEIDELVRRARQTKKPEELVLDRHTLMAPRTALYAPELAEEAPSGPIAAAVQARIRNGGDEALRVRADHAEAIIDFYERRGFRPLWIVDGGLSIRGRRVLSQLGRAEEDGLDRQEYLPPSLIGFDSQGDDLAGAPRALARLELEITRAALLYAHHISVGRVEPSKISRFIDVHPKAPAPDTVLAALGRTVRPGGYLAGLAPRSEGYGQLKALLARYRAIEADGGWTDVPRFARLRPGMRDEGVPALRQRLIESGDYDPPAAVSGEEARDVHPGTGDSDAVAESQVYDQALVEAVRAFQRRRGLVVDGVVGPNTSRALNTPVSRDIEQIVVNMERRRWLPEDLGATHVFVNQADFTMRFVDRGETAYSARVIVGKPNHQSPEFIDEMETVVFNPYWNVPRSIVAEEMLPTLLSRPGYLSESGYEVLDKRGRIVHSADIDWTEAAYNGLPYDVRQLPGRGNALGSVKFLFPNRHAVYMHDTPTQPLFARDVRMFSHGCVRVQGAREFARVIMAREGWSQEDVANAFVTSHNEEVNLEKKIPVYLTYHTAWVADDGTVNLRKDHYGRDERLAFALREVNVALK